jgi:hypothetical protein
MEMFFFLVSEIGAIAVLENGIELNDHVKQQGTRRRSRANHSLVLGIEQRQRESPQGAKGQEPTTAAGASRLVTPRQPTFCPACR